MNNYTDAITQALALSKSRKHEAALVLVDKIDLGQLDAAQLQKLALTFSYANRPERSESCWLEIEQRGEMKPGYFYMLGSIQADQEKSKEAIASLEKELSHCIVSKDSYYLVGTVIRLTYLHSQEKNISRAKQILAFIGDADGDFIPELGYQTKRDLMKCL